MPLHQIKKKKILLTGKFWSAPDIYSLSKSWGLPFNELTIISKSSTNLSSVTLRINNKEPHFDKFNACETWLSHFRCGRDFFLSPLDRPNRITGCLCKQSFVFLGGNFLWKFNFFFSKLDEGINNLKWGRKRLFFQRGEVDRMKNLFGRCFGLKRNSW